MKNNNPKNVKEGSNIFKLLNFELYMKPVRPLKYKSNLPLPGRIARASALLASITGSGFLGYLLFVSTPSYNKETDLKKKTVLVTESAGKFDRDLLKSLAKQGAKIIMTSSNIDECNKSMDNLIRATSIPTVQVECRRLHLDSMISIKRFAGSVIADHPKIDRVILQSPGAITNLVAGTRRVTHDAIEYQLGTNFFAQYLLAHLLVPHLQPEARIIYVADVDAALAGKADASKDENGDPRIPLENINWDSDYDPKKAYYRSQWALLMCINKLHKSLIDTKIHTMVVNPKLVRNVSGPLEKTTITSEISRFINWLIPRKVGTTIFYCAGAPNDELKLSETKQMKHVPIYQDFGLSDKSVETTELNEDIIWRLCEKWCRTNTKHAADKPHVSAQKNALQIPAAVA